MAKRVASTAGYNPLNANDLAACDAVVATADELAAYLDKCTACTMDVGPIRAQADALREFAVKVKEQFGVANNA